VDRPTEGVTPVEAGGRRPRDLALLLLAIGADPPRARARDQQADRAGGALRQRVLDRLAALDPEPSELDAALAAIVAEFGAPTGPTRGVCSQVRQEWDQALASPGAWAWLLAEALERTARADGPDPGRRRARGAP
jgi:hypothetical protein